MDIYLEFKDFARILKKFWWLVPAFFTAGVLLALLNCTAQPSSYTASTSFIVGTELSSGKTPDYSDYIATHNLVNTCSTLLQSKKILNEAIKDCKLDLTPANLLKMMSISVSSDNDIISLKVTASSSAEAIHLASALVAATNRNLTELDASIPIKLSTLDVPSVDTVSDRKAVLIRSLILGGFAGLFVALAVVLMICTIGTKIKKEEVAERVTGFPSLGVLPLIPEAGGTQKGSGDLWEAVRVVKANIRAVCSSGKCIVLTSAEPAEGRSFTAADLSHAFAEAGFKTLLLEADFRRPSYKASLNVQAETGIVDYLGLNAGIDEIISPLAENLDIVTAGKDAARHVNLLDSARMENLLNSLRSRYDYIIVDTPAINLAAEASVLSRFADSALLLIKYDSTTQKSAASAAARLRRAGANTIGYVLGSIPMDVYQDYMDVKLSYYL